MLRLKYTSSFLLHYATDVGGGRSLRWISYVQRQISASGSQYDEI
jgi:hypothetical protein